MSRFIEPARPLPEWDPDMPPTAIANVRAAQARGLRYDPRKRAYVDAEGALIADRYGQPL